MTVALTHERYGRHGRGIVVEKRHRQPGPVARSMEGKPCPLSLHLPLHRWFVFKCKAKHEMKVKQAIEEAGFVAVVPLIYRLRRKNRKRKGRAVLPCVMFEGYVFVGFEPGHVSYRSILDLRWVSQVVSMNGQPRELEHEAVVQWMAQPQMDADGLRKLIAGKPAAIQPEELRRCA